MDTLLKKLEYMQIIQIIEKYCKTYLGKKLLYQLKPSFDLETVENSLSETSQASTLLHQKGPIPLFEIDEVEKYIKMLESRSNFIN